MNRRTLILVLAAMLAVLTAVAVFLVVKGRTVTIKLDENPTTGYRWEYVLSNDNVCLVSDEYVAKASKNIVGAGGTRIFKFRKRAEGSCDISFYYRRSWEEFPKKPDYTYTVK